MDNQEQVDRLNESAMDLVRTLAIENAIDLDDPFVVKMIMVGIRAGSIATFEHVQRGMRS